MLERVNSFGKIVDSGNYLNIDTFRDGMKITSKVCYVTNNKYGQTKTNKGFYTFYVADEKSRVIAMQLFNPEDFLKQGFTVNSMTRHLVVINGYAQLYNGSWSIICEEVHLLNAEEASRLNVSGDVTRFRGSLAFKFSDTLVADYLRIMKDNIPAKYTASSFATHCDGKVNAFAYVIQMVYDSLVGYTNMQFVNKDELLETFFIAAKSYFIYLTAVEEDKYRSGEFMAKTITFIQASYKESKVLEQAIECLMSLVGYSEPFHLYSHLVFEEMRTKEALLNLCDRYASVPAGMSATLAKCAIDTHSKEVGGELILKRY